MCTLINSVTDQTYVVTVLPITHTSLLVNMVLGLYKKQKKGSNTTAFSALPFNQFLFLRATHVRDVETLVDLFKNRIPDMQPVTPHTPLKMNEEKN